MDPRNDRLAYVAFAAACLIWGSTFFAIAQGNKEMPPLWAATLRLVLAAVALGAITIAIRAPWPRGDALKAAVLYGVFNMGINFALLYWGEVVVKSGIAAVFYATVPLSTFAFAALLGLERPSLARVAGAALAVSGVALVFAGEITTDVPVLGLLAILAAATAAALSGVFVKRGPKQDAIPLNAVGSAVGAVITLVGSFLIGEPHALPPTTGAWISVLYLTIAGSLGAFVIWTWLLKTWKASSASMVAVVVPVLAVLLGALAGGERPAVLSYVGAVFVLGGVIVVLRAPHDAPPVASRSAEA